MEIIFVIYDLIVVADLTRSVLCISESFSFCFNFSKAGYGKFPNFLFKPTGDLVVWNEIWEVKGKKTLLPCFPVCDEFRNWK